MIRITVLKYLLIIKSTVRGRLCLPGGGSFGLRGDPDGILL